MEINKNNISVPNHHTPEIKEFYKIDSLGNIIGHIVLDVNDPKTVIPENHFEGWGDKGFHKPKWDTTNGGWIESLTTTEIDELTKNENLYIELSTLETELLKSDWYAIRSIENGKAIPIDIKNQRQTARDRISEIRILLGIV